MNLIIDIGNSRVKLALFQNDKLIEIHNVIETDLIDKVSSINFNSGIISSVGKEQTVDDFSSFFSHVKVLNHKMNFPIILKYDSLSSLGLDRIANCVGAYQLFPERNNLIIDIGSCITYDILNDKNEFLGGSISLGFQMKKKAINEYTSRLPLIDKKLKIFPLIGTDTLSSISSGIINGTIGEIMYTINKYEQLFDDLNVILTGGDSGFVKSIVEIEKNGIFAVENLTLIGLNTILNQNV